MAAGGEIAEPVLEVLDVGSDFGSEVFDLRVGDEAELGTAILAYVVEGLCGCVGDIEGSLVPGWALGFPEGFGDL